MSKTLEARRLGRHRGASLSREIITVVAVAVLLSWLLKTFFLQAFFIPSPSMEPTLHGCDGCQGDRIVVDKLTPGPRDLHRGDVVVFHDPGGWLNDTDAEDNRSPLSPVYDGLEFLGLVPVRSGDDLVKRVIGVAGDTVEATAGGRVVVNGQPLEEPYIMPGVKPSDSAFKVVVPPGRIWVMGDNRPNSEDSRAHIALPDDHGMVPLDNVVGRATAIVWPLKRATWLKRPENFDIPELQPGVAR